MVQPQPQPLQLLSLFLPLPHHQPNPPLMMITKPHPLILAIEVIKALLVYWAGNLRTALLRVAVLPKC